MIYLDAPLKIVIWLIDLLFGTTNWQWFVSNDPMTYYIVVIFACIIVISTISFIFKFLLKLVER